MNSLGERLKAARIAQGLTQERLAAGVATKGFISQVEHNQTTPSLPRLRLLAERLGRPLSYFLDSAPPADAEYLMKAAELAIKAGEARRGLALLDEIAEDELAADERATARRLRGVALRAAGRHSQGLRTLQEAAALAPADHPAVGAAIYAEIGAALGEEELFNPSVEASLRALKWLDESRHPGLDVKAPRRQQQCRERGRRLKESPAVAAAAAELARYALAEGKLGEAIDLSVEARQAAEEAGSHVFQARALGLEGMAADRQGRHAIADRAFRRACDILRGRGALAELAETCARYSNVLRERGDTAGAFAFLQMAYTRQFDGLVTSLRAARRNAYG